MKTCPDRENEPAGRSQVAAITAVAATYAYFLIFAQFGFLQLLIAEVGEGHALLRPIMAVMGVAGIGASIATAVGWTEERARGWMTTGFLVAAGAAGLAWVARTPPWFFGVAALTGAGTGMITVGLATMLRRETGRDGLGLCLGIGTGTAYALCNLPAVFTAAPQTQAGLGIVAAGLGLVAVQGFTQRAPVAPVPGPDYEPPGIAGWTAILLVLVFFDSATFYAVQHTPALKAATWTGGPQLLLIAAAHVVAGLLAGLALRRHLVSGVILAATVLLLGAHALIGSGLGMLGAPLYAAGVSAYSSVLVFYPARSGRAVLAALVYAVAGWLGSALGIGLAADGGALPVWLAPATGLLVAGVLGGLAWMRWRRRCSKI